MSNAQLDQIIEDDLTARLRTVVAAVTGQAAGAGAEDMPFGDTIDVWAYGDPSTRQAPYEPHVQLDDATIIRGVEQWPSVPTAQGPAFPGDHHGDQCEVYLAGRRVVVSGLVQRGQLTVAVSAPDDVPSTAMVRGAQQLIRSTRETTAKADEAAMSSGQQKARRRVTQWVRRALVRRARG